MELALKLIQIVFYSIPSSIQISYSNLKKCIKFKENYLDTYIILFIYI